MKRQNVEIKHIELLSFVQKEKTAYYTIIFRELKISHEKLQKLLNQMMKKGCLKKIISSNKCHYEITDHGKKCLGYLRELEALDIFKEL